MRFEHTNTYDSPVEEVRAMLLDAGFREEVCTYIRAVEHDVTVDDTTPGTTTVRVKQTQVPRKIPSFAQKLVGDTVEIVQEETWTAPDAAGFAMEIPGKPGHLRGQISLRPTATGCDEVFSGDLKVNIPLVGGKLEGVIGDLLKKALTAEGHVGREWLSR